METRNAIYNEHGTIDCEINHPEFGWIPFTASPDDVEAHGKAIYAELLDSGNVAAFIPPTALELAEKEQAVIDGAKAQQKEKLIRQKVEAMLTAEFAEIDAATTEEAAKAVILK